MPIIFIVFKCGNIPRDCNRVTNYPTVTKRDWGSCRCDYPCTALHLATSPLSDILTQDLLFAAYASKTHTKVKSKTHKKLLMSHERPAYPKSQKQYHSQLHRLWKNPTYGVDNSVKRPGTGPFTTRGKHHTPSLYLYLLTITILDFLS